MKNNLILKDNQTITSCYHSYAINSLLGLGGTSVVYRCTRTSNEQKFIIKELLPKFLYDSITRNEDGTLFVQENAQDAFRQAKKLFNDQCIKLNELARKGSMHVLLQVDNFEANGTVYAVYYDFAGDTLDNRIKVKTLEAIFEAAQIVDGILECLGAIHDQGYLHLDISPDNIFVSETIMNNRKKVMLIDYGSIFSLNAATSESEERLYAVLSHKDKYSANELFRSVEYQEYQPLSYATDLYSVTAVMYQLIFGHAPNALEAILAVSYEQLKNRPLFKSTALRAMKKCAEILNKGLASNMEDRYQSIDEMGQDIKALLNLCDNKKHYLNYELPPRNPNFFGRKQELKRMKELLVHPKGKELPKRAIYIYGEDGMGKTELCVEFCHRFNDIYENICFLHFAHNFNETFARMDILNLEKTDLVIRDDKNLLDQVVHYVNRIEGKTLIVIEDIRHIYGEKQYIDVARMAGDNIQFIFTSCQQQHSFALDDLIRQRIDSSRWDEYLKIVERNTSIMKQIDVLPFDYTKPDVKNRFIGEDADLQRIAEERTQNTLLLFYAKKIKEKNTFALYDTFCGRKAVNAIMYEYCNQLSHSSLMLLWILSFFEIHTIDSVLIEDFNNMEHLLSELEEYKLVKIEYNNPGKSIFINPLVFNLIEYVIKRQMDEPNSLLMTQKCEPIYMAVNIPSNDAITYWGDVFNFYMNSWKWFMHIGALIKLLQNYEEVMHYLSHRFSKHMSSDLKAVYGKLIKDVQEKSNETMLASDKVSSLLKSVILYKYTQDLDQFKKVLSVFSTDFDFLKNYPFYYAGMTLQKQFYELKNLKKYLIGGKPLKNYKYLGIH